MIYDKGNMFWHKSSDTNFCQHSSMRLFTALARISQYDLFSLETFVLAIVPRQYLGQFPRRPCISAFRFTLHANVGDMFDEGDPQVGAPVSHAPLRVRVVGLIHGPDSLGVLVDVGKVFARGRQSEKV